ncbi:hypothetical protein BDY17DRAFT_320343 [Neohortaea acidophila]|uniref:Uncharacterized protein n=1 Tax=Neohortaea acidophila TaxID=245834 RepID=A0A6A6Q726_9PEZI|nr:uncharacterized protein BDY17DRAFT_320343 [Neohortaea acidophila]KAF2487829.1 hypothetical protein BDY17DRAFT_320343 [Neohortaea acidophila]
MSKTSAGKSKKLSSQSRTSEYPSPFEKAPSTIEPFLPQLDPSQIYITHIDRHPRDYKKQIFSFAVFVNATIAALLLWRIYAITPKYFALLQTIFGYANSESVDTIRTTRSEQVWIVLRRTGMMAFDFFVFRLIGPWPLTFFLERPANPVTWRWNIGFKAEEVVVRVSRNWTGEDLMKGTKRGEDSPFFKTRIEPAIETQFMEKTGYLMMGGNWDLDFGLMQDAHVLLKQDKMKVEAFDRYVLAHHEKAGWLAWKFATVDVSGGDVGLELRKAMEGLEDEETTDKTA